MNRELEEALKAVRDHLPTNPHRYRYEIIDIIGLGITDIAEELSLEPNVLLRAIIERVVQNKPDALEVMALSIQQPPDMANLDSMATILDSWITEKTVAIIAQFFHLGMAGKVTDIKVAGNVALIEIDELELDDVEVIHF